MPIRIYDYEASKIPFMLKLTTEVLDREVGGSYYLDTDWLHGPSILITAESSEDEVRLLDSLTACTLDYKKEHPLRLEQIEAVQFKYLKEQRRLGDLELRTDTDGRMREDGEIEQGEGKTGVYNSDYHRKLFHEFRCRLQNANNLLLAEISMIDEKSRIRVFTDMFLHIATLYNGDAASGYISYLSHVLGFFSRLRLEGHPENVQERFERLYLSVFAEKQPPPGASLQASLNLWKEAWNDVAAEMRQGFDKTRFKQDDHLELYDQHRRFEQYIAGMDNPFHRRLLDRDDLEELMMSDEMLVYRNVINLFYMTLPMFEQGMAQKHVYGYCAIRCIESSRTGLLMTI